MYRSQLYLQHDIRRREPWWTCPGAHSGGPAELVPTTHWIHQVEEHLKYFLELFPFRK